MKNFVEQITKKSEVLINQDEFGTNFGSSNKSELQFQMYYCLQ